MSETCKHHITVSWPVNAYGDPTGYTACSLCGAVFQGEQRVQIVPAGAVVLSAEEAAGCREGLLRAALAFERWADDPWIADDMRGEHRATAERYRALAAKLGGER